MKHLKPFNEAKVEKAETLQECPSFKEFNKVI